MVKQMALAMWEARKGFDATNVGNESRAPRAVRLSNSVGPGQSSYDSSRMEKYELLRIFRMASLLMSWNRNTLRTSRFTARNRE
jgi:hypothetical protein